MSDKYWWQKAPERVRQAVVLPRRQRTEEEVEAAEAAAYEALRLAEEDEGQRIWQQWMEQWN